MRHKTDNADKMNETNKYPLSLYTMKLVDRVEEVSIPTHMIWSMEIMDDIADNYTAKDIRDTIATTFGNPNLQKIIEKLNKYIDGGLYMALISIYTFLKEGNIALAKRVLLGVILILQEACNTNMSHAASKYCNIYLRKHNCIGHLSDDKHSSYRLCDVVPMIIADAFSKRDYLRSETGDDIVPNLSPREDILLLRKKFTVYLSYIYSDLHDILRCVMSSNIQIAEKRCTLTMKNILKQCAEKDVPGILYHGKGKSKYTTKGTYTSYNISKDIEKVRRSISPDISGMSSMHGSRLCRQ